MLSESKVSVSALSTRRRVKPKPCASVQRVPTSRTANPWPEAVTCRAQGWPWLPPMSSPPRIMGEHSSVEKAST